LRLFPVKNRRSVSSSANDRIMRLAYHVERSAFNAVRRATDSKAAPSQWR
jgi:hypothetical protein